LKSAIESEENHFKSALTRYGVEEGDNPLRAILSPYKEKLIDHCFLIWSETNKLQKRHDFLAACFVTFGEPWCCGDGNNAFYLQALVACSGLVLLICDTTRFLRV
jgi:hypothetical protein